MYAGADLLDVLSSIPMISICTSSDEIIPHLNRESVLTLGADASVSSMHLAIHSIHETLGRPRDSISWRSQRVDLGVISGLSLIHQLERLSQVLVEYFQGPSSIRATGE